MKLFSRALYRFSSIIVPELLAFSVAMQITFEAAPGPLPDSFSHLGITILTMFKLMLGLEDFGVLSDAAHPWLAVTLFILFVITNNILMINTLIAMMSATCSFISENKVGWFRPLNINEGSETCLFTNW